MGAVHVPDGEHQWERGAAWREFLWESIRAKVSRRQTALKMSMQLLFTIVELRDRTHGNQLEVCIFGKIDFGTPKGRWG
jgi:hypothetical protein